MSLGQLTSIQKNLNATDSDDNLETIEELDG